MIDWSRRSPEVQHLLNPAFCSLLLNEAIRGYRVQTNAGMPYSLVLLLLPIVLHRPTRDALPNTTRTKLLVWLHEHQEAKIGFSQRASQLMEFGKEAVLFGLQHGLFRCEENGRFLPVRLRLRRPNWSDISEPAVCFVRAGFVGRWLAAAGDPATIYAAWGVRP